MHRPLWIEINLGGLKNNLRVVRNIAGRGAGILAVVKQAAYGHGLLPVQAWLQGSRDLQQLPDCKIQ